MNKYFFLLILSASFGRSEHFDIVLRSQNQAIGIVRQKIIAVAPNLDCQNPCQDVDVSNLHIYPGLHDSHAHQISGGRLKFIADARGSSIAAIQSSLRNYLQTHSQKTWIYGRGWNASILSRSGAHKKHLDEVSQEKAIYLLDSDGHSLWVNSKALELSGINKNTKDPVGGTIQRDASGEPTGILLEKATRLIFDAAPPATEQELREYILEGQSQGLVTGFTSTQGGGVSNDVIKAYKNLAREGKILQRTFLWGDLTANDADLKELVQLSQELGPESPVRVVALKAMVDGVVSSYTAALHAPYTDRPETSGSAAFSQEELNRLVLRANKNGVPVALHVIGDKSVTLAINAFENSYRQLQHALVNRLEHVELIDPQDLTRLANLKIAASFQPSHMHFGSAGSSYYPARLGERLRYTFSWNSLKKAGALLLFGTDFPVVDQDPIEALHCATQRTYLDGTPFFPEERVTFSEALKAFTTNPALAIGMEKILGKIEPGFLADIVGFRKPLDDKNLRSLRDNSPAFIMVQGKILRKEN